MGDTIPKRGPVTRTHPNGGWVDLFWSPEWRSWGVVRRDAQGDQVGSGEWSAHREQAADVMREWLSVRSS